MPFSFESLRIGCIHCFLKSMTAVETMLACRHSHFYRNLEFQPAYSLTYFDVSFLFSADFMKLTNEYIHLKCDSNSILNGYWTSDIGGLNEVTHIWEYGINTVHYTQYTQIFIFLLRYALITILSFKYIDQHFFLLISTYNIIYKCCFAFSSAF